MLNPLKFIQLSKEVSDLRSRVALLSKAVEALRAQQPTFEQPTPDLPAASLEPSKIPLYVPLGHYYSPVPDPKEVLLHEGQIFNRAVREFPGIDLRESHQMELVRALQNFYDEQPFLEHKTDNLRYFYNNDAYGYSDGVFLYCMLRLLKPKRYLEIGSGFSSALVMDVNDLFFDGQIDLTFIEPYPNRLFDTMKAGDRKKTHLIQLPLQEVEPSHFDQLGPGDILFVDSTHVTRVGSDVNRIFFEILPSLAAGVYIHFHDIFHPFEYPKEWLCEGRGWTELYLLRAFLQFNQSFEIVLFNTFLEEFHREYFARHMPLCLVNPGGSIWLRKI